MEAKNETIVIFQVKKKCMKNLKKNRKKWVCDAVHFTLKKNPKLLLSAEDMKVYVTLKHVNKNSLIFVEQELMEDVSTLTGGGGYQRKTPDTVIEGVMRENDLVFETDALQEIKKKAGDFLSNYPSY